MVMLIIFIKIEFRSQESEYRKGIGVRLVDSEALASRQVDSLRLLFEIAKSDCAFA